MNEFEREEILSKAKLFFQEKVADNHIKNTAKLDTLSAFNINPFTLRYLANFAFGSCTAENMAKALVYPRILGTSIATTFGTQLQFFCNEVLSSFASTTSGIDIEFIDATDHRKKYCQIKSGPNTINHDDVTTIVQHFAAIKNLAKTNRMTDFNPMYDCVVGVFYGTEQELSASYRSIARDYPVIVGQDFWYRLTGDPDFYFTLIDAFAEVAIEIDSTDLIKQVIGKLSEQLSESD